MRKRKIKPEGPRAPILVWPWRDAPWEYRVLSTRGGNERWVAFIPAEYGALRPGWAKRGTVFAPKRLDSFRLAGGGRALLGSS